MTRHILPPSWLRASVAAYLIVGLAMRCTPAAESPPPNTNAEGPTQVEAEPETSPSETPDVEEDTLFSVVTLHFAPGKTQLSDSLAEVLTLAFNRNFPTGAVFGVTQGLATLELLATPAPQAGTSATTLAKRRARTVQRFLIAHWTAFAIAQRNHAAIRPRALPADSARLAGGQGAPGSVEILYQGRRFADEPSLY